MVAKRSAAGERTQTINQARALVLTGPDDLRARFARHTAASLVAGTASLRPRPGDVVAYATRVALRELGRRAEFLDGQLERLDELIVPPVTAHAPGLLALYGVGPNTAALLLIAAGDHPERLRSEAAWAHLCAAAPIPASSGKTVRHRTRFEYLVAAFHKFLYMPTGGLECAIPVVLRIVNGCADAMFCPRTGKRPADARATCLAGTGC